MLKEERDELTTETRKMIARVIKRLNKVDATIAEEKIYGCFDAIYDSLADLNIVRNRISSLSADAKSGSVRATGESKVVKEVVDEPSSD